MFHLIKLDRNRAVTVIAAICITLDINLQHLEEFVSSSRQKSSQYKIIIQYRDTGIKSFRQTMEILDDFPPYKPDLFPRKRVRRKNKVTKSELTDTEVELLVTCTGYTQQQVK